MPRTCASSPTCRSATSTKPANSLDFTAPVATSVGVAISWNPGGDFANRSARISCGQVGSTQSIEESFGWRWESQRGGQGKAERGLRRNLNLLVSGKRAPHESCGCTYEGTDACSLSSSCQSADQRTSGR